MGMNLLNNPSKNTSNVCKFCNQYVHILVIAYAIIQVIYHFAKFAGSYRAQERNFAKCVNFTNMVLI